MTVYDTRQAAMEMEKELQEHSREKLLGFSRKREPIGCTMISRTILTPLAGGKVDKKGGEWWRTGEQ